MQVSWIRKHPEDLQLLTVGEMTHSSDARVEAVFTYPHSWSLRFDPVLATDSATYYCHVSSDPPLIRFVVLQVTSKVSFKKNKK